MKAMNKPLPHLTIRSGPWAGTMVRFATVEQFRAVMREARQLKWSTEELVSWAIGNLQPPLNAPQPKES